jgi:hypothetical protein
MLKTLTVLALVAVATADEVHPAGWGGVKNWVDPQYKLERPKGYVFQDTLVEGQKPVEKTTWYDDSCPKCQFREHNGELVVEVVHGNTKTTNPNHMLLAGEHWNPADNHMCYAESVDSQDPRFCADDSGVKGYKFSHNGKWTKHLAFFEDTASVSECSEKCNAHQACNSFARYRDGECYLYANGRMADEKGYVPRGKKTKNNACWHWWSSVTDASLDPKAHATAQCREEKQGKSCTSASDGCTCKGNPDQQVVYSRAQWQDKGENVCDWVAFEQCREGVGLPKRAKQGVPDQLGTNKCVCVCGDTTKEFTYNGKYMTETKRFIHGHGTVSPDGNLRAKQLAIDQYVKGKKAGASIFYGRNYGKGFKKSYKGKSNGQHESKFNNEDFKSYKSKTNPTQN